MRCSAFHLAGLLTGIEGASSRPVCKIVVLDG
jgi:hypothetical protein